jgi:hypothetical protein
MPVEDEAVDDTPERRGVDRRTLIKGAALAGAAAWTAPVIIDSFSSAAAALACSVNPTITFKTSLNGNTDTAGTTWATPAFTATAGSKIVVFIAQSNQNSASATVSSVTGNMISGASQLASVLDYDSHSTTRTHDFYVWTGTGVAAASGALTVTFSATNDPSNVSLSVYQVVGSTSIASTSNNGTGATASLSYAAPPANNVELWGVAGANGDTTAFNWTPGVVAPVWTEDVDAFNTAGGSSSRSFGFETAHRTTTAANSGSFTTSNASTPDWAAIRVLLGC